MTTHHISSPRKLSYVPVTPGGTLCFWLTSDTEDEAWDKLLKDTAHMPYRSKTELQERGYCVEAMNFVRTS